jgi:hypothetical protein
MKQIKTIPFDWEEYNNNRDKYKVVTRNGDEVTQLTKFEEVSSYSSLIGVKNKLLYSWYDKGQFASERESNFDLQLQYEEDVVESWVNLYMDHNSRLATSPVYPNEQIAKKISINTMNYIKTINLNELI